MIEGSFNGSRMTDRFGGDNSQMVTLIKKEAFAFYDIQSDNSLKLTDSYSIHGGYLSGTSDDLGFEDTIGAKMHTLLLLTRNNR